MKITNNTTNIKQHKCLQKISEIVDKTQLKKKQFKYVININHEPDDKIKKDLEKSLDKKDVLIKKKTNFFTHNLPIWFFLILQNEMDQLELLHEENEEEKFSNKSLQQ
ncbi:hypothetical protein ACTFIT_004637 [Dictyostelium discoideum]